MNFWSSPACYQWWWWWWFSRLFLFSSFKQIWWTMGFNFSQKWILCKKVKRRTLNRKEERKKERKKKDFLSYHSEYYETRDPSAACSPAIHSISPSPNHGNQLSLCSRRPWWPCNHRCEWSQAMNHHFPRGPPSTASPAPIHAANPSCSTPWCSKTACERHLSAQFSELGPQKCRLCELNQKLSLARPPRFLCLKRHLERP